MAKSAIRSRSLASGDKLGKFELIRQLAIGGMAELYLARTMGIEGFEKLVVVKRMLPQYASDQAFVSMFLAEARLSATLHHPNIAQVYDIGVEDGDYFFSMEYVHGEDLMRLHDAAQQQGVPMSLDAVLTLATGLCAGLHYAHEKTGPDGKPLAVVHRDVSPSNILVSYDGGIKLIDFGIARAGNSPRNTRGGLKGKIEYMSPEQCRGDTALDRRSDIYAIGTVLYELTTGRRPFAGGSEFAMLEQIVHTDVPPPTTIVPDYPPALAAIIMRALNRDPAVRFATANEMQGQLEDFAHESRLRISPLVLVRLMSSLFPARLEEWDQARAQGAFFVEQHIMSTLSGREGQTGSDSGLLSVPQNHTIADDPVGPPTPRPRMASPTVDAVTAAMKTAPMIAVPAGGFQIPGAVPISARVPGVVAINAPVDPAVAALDDEAPTMRRTPNPLASSPSLPPPPPVTSPDTPHSFVPPPSYPPSRSFVPTGASAALASLAPPNPYSPVGGGVLISNRAPDGHVPVAVPAAGEVTERVLLPRARNNTQRVAGASRWPVIAAVFVLVIGAAGGGYWYLGRNIPSSVAPAVENEAVPTVEIDAAPIVEIDAAARETAPIPDEPKADEPTVDEPKADEPTADEPTVDEPKFDEKKAVEKKATKTKLPAKKTPKKIPVKKVKKTTKKDSQWNADSPFMPVH